MLPEIESIRRALASLDALDEETRGALATLEAALDEIDRLPESQRVREVVAETAGSLASGEEDSSGGLAERWSELKEQVGHWEEEHPRLVLAIGRVSNSLAAFGL
jgi:chromosome segregation ATPase